MNNFKCQEICRYVLVGCSGVICDYLLYSGLLYLGWQLNYAKMTSFCIGAGYVFVVQKYWTFRNSGRAMKQLPKNMTPATFTLSAEHRFIPCFSPIVTRL